MGRRPTISDVASTAGVSVATVDRVLNGRHPVREETARRVYEAATEIGYHASNVILQRMSGSLPEVRLGFLLHKRDQSFYQAFAAEIERAVAATPGVAARAQVRYVTSQSPKDIVADLESLAETAQAIAMTSIDHHMVTAAVQSLKSCGIPVYSLLSDFAQGVRESYVGTNNVKVGRTTAWLISRTARSPGKVAVFVGGHRWHGHELRETGFRSYFREHAPEFQVVETLVNLDTREVTYEATLELLGRHKDMRGFYVAGGGMEGAIAALRELQRSEDEISVIVNELTPDTQLALQDHLITAVVATPLEQICRAAIDLMVSAIAHGPAETPGQMFLPFDLHVPESV
ncbi:LacI family DNA-binding transcriptional regulator [Roseibium salinum]|uniref:LacI family DNA-binding transcriptional regulator n=1 Tax=Roseibium salinum TaxID=1604349 RepID=A0ABT3QWA0_9HYPH|nr:LacI family DNA-binding transcriptional regulator [Roseibium sp. DSM 29163]MCX2721197.1 LacI family DNA-binding transcriptional regulator [Roseibium sp. DSM 29163]